MTRGQSRCADLRTCKKPIFALAKIRSELDLNAFKWFTRDQSRESRLMNNGTSHATMTQASTLHKQEVTVGDWRRKMSDHIAYALLVYTALQIFVTVGALKAGGGSLLPYLALVILVIAIIPACRRFESRWNKLTDKQAHDPALASYYRRDRMLLWALAIGLPFGLTALFKGLALAFT
tara:strand:+ start:1985 stop:2518 length:534 start_codon:yes stop_codon:yes gene_type:complete